MRANYSVAMAPGGLLLDGAESPQAPLLSFLAKPYALAYGGFLFVMVCLSVAHEGVQDLAMLIRWPTLGLLAFIGLFQATFRGMRVLTAAHWTLGLFVVIAGVSSIYSPDANYTALRAVSIALLFLATFVGLYAYCEKLENAISLTDVLWLLGAFVVVGGFLFRLAGLGSSASGRYEGLHDRATGAGTYSALFLPIAVYHARYRFRGILRLAGWGIVGLFFLQALLSSARAAIVSCCFISLALWLDYYGKKALLALVAAALILPIPLLLDRQNVEKLQDRSEAILRAESLSTFTGRLDRWVFGLEQFVVKPLFGHGFGASRTLAGEEDPTRFKLAPGEVFNLHSDQIEVLMDLGVFGYAFFGSFWLVLLTMGFRLVSQPRSPSRQLGLAYLGGAMYALLDTFMHGGFLAAGGGVSSFSWSMIAAFLAMAARCSMGADAPTEHATTNIATLRLAGADGLASETEVRDRRGARKRAISRKRLPSSRELIGRG